VFLKIARKVEGRGKTPFGMETININENRLTEKISNDIFKRHIVNPAK